MSKQRKPTRREVLVAGGVTEEVAGRLQWAADGAFWRRRRKAFRETPSRDLRNLFPCKNLRPEPSQT